jgi:hypothetical protein
MHIPVRDHACETRELFLEQKPAVGGLAAFFAAMLVIFLIAGTLIGAISRLP